MSTGHTICECLEIQANDYKVRIFKYVLSMMGVSKESISKFLIGNRFHVTLRILSPENCKKNKLKPTIKIL